MKSEKPMSQSSTADNKANITDKETNLRGSSALIVVTIKPCTIDMPQGRQFTNAS